jgi:uncharacterized protein (DUF58 family)
VPTLGLLDSLFSLRWYERDQRHYSLLLRQRGLFPIGPARLESGDMFGIFEQVREDQEQDFLVVFPTQQPLETLRLPTDDPFGDRRAHRRLYEDPNLPMGIRDYHPEDDFRRLHWPATAHTGALQVKVYQPVSAQVMVACLNVSTFPHYWEGTYPELLEYLLSVTASIVQHGLEEGYRVGLISNGTLAHADQTFRIMPGRSKDQLARLLTVLASVTPITTGSFDRFLISEIPRLPYGATLVIITGMINAALEEAILRLKQHGRRINLLCFAQEAPAPIPGVRIFHQPFAG